MSEATKRPWKLKNNSVVVAGDVEYTASWRLHERTRTTYEERCANARLIVHAVNTYDEREALIRELVAALERATDTLDVDNLTMQSVERDCRKTLARAKQVMAPDAAPRPGHDAGKTGEG